MDAETLGRIFASRLCTAIGGAFTLLVRNLAGRLLDVPLGFTAGVMLAATAFSLLVPAAAATSARRRSRCSPAWA